jgi:hypothetical protein
MAEEEKKPGSDRTRTLDEGARENLKHQPDRASNDWVKKSWDVTDTVSPPKNPNKQGDNNNGQ